MDIGREASGDVRLQTSAEIGCPLGLCVKKCTVWGDERNGRIQGGGQSSRGAASWHNDNGPAANQPAAYESAAYESASYDDYDGASGYDDYDSAASSSVTGGWEVSGSSGKGERVVGCCHWRDR